MKFYSTVAISVCVAGLAQAAQFKFKSLSDPPDLLVGFRQVGSSSEIVADLGPITRFLTAPSGSSFQITEVSTNEILKVFPSLDGLGISFFGGVVKTKPLAGNPVNKTIWVSAPRANPDVPSDPIYRRGSPQQGPTATRCATVGTYAAAYSANVADGPDNDGNLVLMPADYPNGYTAAVGPNGDLGGTYDGNVELILPSDFVSGGLPARADFYELVPSSDQEAAGTYLGYFEILPNAVIRFQAAGGSPPPPADPPVIQGITRSGSLNTITFATQPGNYQYSLQRTLVVDSHAQWSTVGAAVVGTGGALSLSDTADAGTAFYRVQVVP